MIFLKMLSPSFCQVANYQLPFEMHHAWDKSRLNNTWEDVVHFTVRCCNYSSSNNVCKLSYYHIRDLCRIRKHLNLDQAKCLASALVSSRLDYCSSLLLGVAVRDMLKLQRVQNCLARVVTRAGRFAPSISHRHSLYWWPISCRIQFKIQDWFSGKPPYLADLIHLATPNRNLRLNNGPLLPVPECMTKTETRVFSVCAPSLWNKFPLCIRLFWVPDFFSATSINAPFGPYVSSLVS